ncbi:MAG TPA: hypothetical protein PK208_09945 [Fibrobacteria bacterium]|nr:hypothetical protein [Fibrobacteria bacterium]
MNRSIGFLLVSVLGAIGAKADPGPWRRLPLPSGQGMVSALAVGNGTIAVGATAGGVVLLDSSSRPISVLRDPSFGKTGRIYSLVWSGTDLWIASEGGLFRYDAAGQRLDRARNDLPPSLRSGAKVLAAHGGAVWGATSRAVACFRSDRSLSHREWGLPIQDEPTSLLKVGGRILVGTSSKGLLVLDSSTGAWIRIGRAEGLSSDQVTGLEWVGAEVFVATPEGLDLLDLSSQKVRVLFPDLLASWMTQANGTLFVTSFDGLVRVDATARTKTVVAMPGGVRPEGALSFGDATLVAASGEELFARSHPTIFGSDGFRLAPQGFRLELPAGVPSGAKIQAFLRLPEWPEAKMALVVDVVDAGSALLVRMPPEIRGLVQIDLVASTGAKVDEVRSLEGVGDRTKPVLALDPIRSVVRDSQIDVSGRATGVAGLRLALLPGIAGFEPGPDGTFRRSVALSHGENRFELVLEDGIGNRTSRGISVRRDDRPPSIATVPDDTVAGDFARIRVPYREAGSVRASASASAQVRVSVFDSFVVLEARKLVVGSNSIRLVLEDEAGNASTKTVHVVRRQAPTAILATSWGFDALDNSSGGDGGAKTRDTGRSVHVVHYRMVEGETLCGVAEHFYGGQPLAEVLIRWNGFADSSQWRRMPVGTPVEVPFWKDFDYGNPDLKSAMESFPWDRIPMGPRSRK